MLSCAQQSYTSTHAQLATAARDFLKEKMADELVIDGKKLSDLKLVDIRRELGKRNLPKKGSKMVTLKRLEKAILEEKTKVSVNSFLFATDIT